MRVGPLVSLGLLLVVGCSSEEDPLSPVDTDTDDVVKETGVIDTGETDVPPLIRVLRRRRCR